MVIALISLSLANLCYLRIWDVLLHHPEREYLADTPFSPTDYFAVMAGVCLLALGLSLFIEAVWNNDNRWIRAGAMLVIFVVFLFPLDFVRRSSGAVFDAYSGKLRYLLVFGTSVGLFGSAVIFRRRFYSSLFWLLGVLSPYVAVNFAETIAHAVADPTPVIPRRFNEPAAAEEKSPANRVVWIIFDELDQSVLFERRPDGLKLPRLDAFLDGAVIATQAYPPAGMTLASVPAMLTGRLISGAEGKDDDELDVRYADENAWHDFRESGNIVTDALRGRNHVAVRGWYHPYDRIFPQSPNLEASSWGFPLFQAFRGSDLISSIAAQYKFLAFPNHSRAVCRDLYLQMHASALKDVANPKVDLVFLHYGIPHTPGIYDPKINALSSTFSLDLTSSYLANLALADRTLGELLDAVEFAGLGKRTSFIVTSDHWWRSSPWSKVKPDYRVPFFVRVPAGGAKLLVNVPICTTALRGVINDMLEGVVGDNAALAARLARENIGGPMRYANGYPEVTRR